MKIKAGTSNRINYRKTETYDAAQSVQSVHMNSSGHMDAAYQGPSKRSTAVYKVSECSKGEFVMLACKIAD